MLIVPFKLFFRILRRLRVRMNYSSSRFWFNRIPRLLFRCRCPIDPVDTGEVRGEWIGRNFQKRGGIVLYFHGGAFVSGSPRSHRHLICRIARASSSAVFAPVYRLAPENPFPAAVQDAFAAYFWLLEQGTEPERIFVAGDSAGGGLALLLLQGLRDRGIPLPSGAVFLSPWTDLSCKGRSWWNNADKDPVLSRDQAIVRAELFSGGRRLDSPEISPVFGDLSGLPPILVQVGSEESLLDDSRCLAEKARASGIEVDLQIWSGVMHVWQYLAPYFSPGSAAIEKIGSYIKQHLQDG